MEVGGQRPEVHLGGQHPEEALLRVEADALRRMTSPQQPEAPARLTTRIIAHILDVTAATTGAAVLAVAVPAVTATICAPWCLTSLGRLPDGGKAQLSCLVQTGSNFGHLRSFRPSTSFHIIGTSGRSGCCRFEMTRTCTRLSGLSSWSDLPRNSISLHPAAFRVVVFSHKNAQMCCERGTSRLANGAMGLQTTTCFHPMQGLLRESARLDRKN